MSTCPVLAPVPSSPPSHRAEPHPRAGRVPQRRVVASAPMRISLAGGGTDLPPFLPDLPGRIVGTAIDVRIRVVVEPFDRGWVRLDVPGIGRSALRRRADGPLRDHGVRLLEAALAAVGVEEGVRVQVDTSVLPGAGLGGSASAAVATLAALRHSLGEPQNPAEMAAQASAMERDRLGIACGSQDQVVAAFGGLLDLRFEESGCSSIRAIDPPSELLARFGAGLLIVDTHVRRVSGDVIRRLDPEAVRASIPELVAAAGDVARGFEEGSLDLVLAGMRRSARAKERRYGAADGPGDLERTLSALGAEVVRVCGAGGGGHVLVWAPPECHGAIASAVGPLTVRRPAIAAPGVRLEH